MKKLFLIAALASFTLGNVFAQTPQPATTVKTSTAVAPATSEKKELKKSGMKKSKVLATNTKNVKSDGTPDMRFKENKNQKAVSGPKKSDGTPDMRYKSNQPATPTTK